MTSLKRLVSNRRPAHNKRGSQDGNEISIRPRSDCPFCGRRGTPAEAIGTYGHPVWRCLCGAIASGSLARELDEVGDQVLPILGIDGAIGEPVITIDHPGIVAQSHDADKTGDSLRDLLKSHGFELRTSVSGMHEVIWIATTKPPNYW